MEQKLKNQLLELKQEEVLKGLINCTPQQIHAFQNQLQTLDQAYPGGISTYLQRAKQILNQSKEGTNPYVDYVPSVPKGYSLDFYNNQLIDEYEKLGMQQIRKCVFVLVAGGLGQRLGYSGIKLEIPFNLLNMKCFLQYYIEYMLVFQNKLCQNTLLQLAIMTSEDTHQKTIQLLQKHDYFGMKKSQIILMKQQKVIALIDNDGRFSMKSPFQIQTKPHGHGDVHTLIYQNNLHNRWMDQGRKWVIFFQDTNPLIFRSILGTIGVSAKHNLQVNSIAIPRKKGQAVGAITYLMNKKGQTLTINVQYNQLEGLLKEFGGQKVDSNGISKYPGNTNGLVFRLEQYRNTLNETKGVISEFINPKYANEQKTKFKTGTRLQCMMQDYPKLLKSGERVSFTLIDKKFCFSTMKNDLATAINKQKMGLSQQSAATCQSQYYWMNRQILRIAGAQIEQAQPLQFSGLKIKIFPMVYINPKFGLSMLQIRNKVGKLKIKKNATLQVEQGQLLEGQIIGSCVWKNKLIVLQKNVELVSCQEGQEEYLRIRGYKKK